MNIYEIVSNFYESVRTEKSIIGNSFFGRNIYAVKIGDGMPTGIAQYAIHGREFITAHLAMLHFEVGLQKGSCWLIPLANPDGCLLSEIGLPSAPKEKQKELCRLNKGSEDFSLW